MFLTVHSCFQGHSLIFYICDCFKVAFVSQNSEEVILVVNKEMCFLVRLATGGKAQEFNYCQ